MAGRRIPFRGRAAYPDDEDDDISTSTGSEDASSSNSDSDSSSDSSSSDDRRKKRGRGGRGGKKKGGGKTDLLSSFGKVQGATKPGGTAAGSTAGRGSGSVGVKEPYRVTSGRPADKAGKGRTATLMNSGTNAMTKRIKELMDENEKLREQVKELKLQCDEVDVAEQSAEVDALAALTSVVYGTVRVSDLPLFSQMSTESTTVTVLHAGDTICLVHPISELENGDQWAQAKHVDAASAETTMCYVCVKSKARRANVHEFRP